MRDFCLKSLNFLLEKREMSLILVIIRKVYVCIEQEDVIFSSHHPDDYSHQEDGYDESFFLK